MAGTPEEDVVAAEGIRYFFKKGHTFEQSWAKIPMGDEDYLKLEALDAKNTEILTDDSWRGMKPCCPIISGGLNPTLLKPFIDIMGNVDFVTTMGAGAHAHPRGTKVGATSLVQACEAYQKGISIYEYAKDHVELAEAIEFFEKKKGEKITEAQKEAEHAGQAEENM